MIENRQCTNLDQINFICINKQPHGLLVKYHYFEVNDKAGNPHCRVSIHKHGMKHAWKKAILSMAKINGTSPMISAIRRLPRVTLS